MPFSELGRGVLLVRLVLLVLQTPGHVPKVLLALHGLVEEELCKQLLRLRLLRPDAVQQRAQVAHDRPEFFASVEVDPLEVRKGQVGRLDDALAPRLVGPLADDQDGEHGADVARLGRRVHELDEGRRLRLVGRPDLLGGEADCRKRALKVRVLARRDEAQKARAGQLVRQRQRGRGDHGREQHDERVQEAVVLDQVQTERRVPQSAVGEGGGEGVVGDGFPGAAGLRPERLRPASAVDLAAQLQRLRLVRRHGRRQQQRR
mmetsp:Transcript_31270/g.105205  ORF Transcript_31270/g.105205 Transcript_31270/m.105205 type:complete len:261 (+) Transcript_31270:54-836(+)